VTTPAHLARARADQAAADLTAAAAELLAAMLAVEPNFTGTVEAMQDRRWEARLEGQRPLWELGQAYSAWRRAQRLEAKARSAAYRAALPLPPIVPSKPAKTPRPKAKAAGKTTLTAYVRERWGEEARAA